MRISFLFFVWDSASLLCFSHHPRPAEPPAIDLWLPVRVGASISPAAWPWPRHIYEGNHFISIQLMSLPVSPFWPPSPHHSFSMTPLPLRAGKKKRKKNWPECTDCERVAQQQPSQQPPLCCASCECFINCHLLQEFLKATWFTLRCNKKKKKILFSLQQKRKAQRAIQKWAFEAVQPIVFGSGFSGHFSSLNNVPSQEVWISTVSVWTVGGWD